MAAKLTGEELKEFGYRIIQDTILNKVFHPHYKHTVELSRLYMQLITGKDADKLLKQFVRREDAALFKQRTELTQAVTPSVSATIMNPYYKVGRVNNIVKKIDFAEGNEFEEKKKILLDSLDKYFGEQSLDDYLTTRFTNLCFTDPNAFLITEFEGLETADNGKVEGVPQPRPFEASSEMCVNYAYDNNILKWLIVRMPVDLESNGKKEKGFNYTIYLAEWSISFNQIIPDQSLINLLKNGDTYEFDSQDGDSVKIFKADERRFFVVNEYNHKSKEVPAKCVGYKQDLTTLGTTYVSPLHDALPYFMKTIKTVSEFDLTMALHAFPQKFQYVQRCQGLKDHPCTEGKLISGEICGVCNGNGYAIHSSAQDAITMRIPKNKDEMIELEKLMIYKYPPIDLLKFQNEFIEKLENKAKQAVFNSEIFNRAEITATATEMRISLDSVYDTIYPFAVKFSQMYSHVATIAAYYQDLSNFTVIHKFPRDFKFKGLTDLLNELKLANDSNAPGYVRKELSSDIAAIQYEDKPADLARIVIKQKFYPFPDKTDTEIIYIISNKLTTKFNEVLWSNFDSIFAELEFDAEQKKQYFYNYAYNLQRELLSAKVQEYISKIEGETPAPVVPFGNTSITEE